MIVIPDAFATTTIAREGDAGRAWVAALPAVIQTLCDRWDLLVDGAPMHGYLGIVVPVRQRDRQAVLKVSWKDLSTSGEAAALAAWDGQGAARLFNIDAARGAQLLERLDFRRSLSDVPITEAVTLAGRLLRRLAIEAPSGFHQGLLEASVGQSPFRSLRTVADELVEQLPIRWEQHGRPTSRHVLDRAIALARELGASSANRLVNYDIHYADVLASTREPWLAVDPKVVTGEPAFGLAQLLWTRLAEMEADGGLDRHFRALTETAEVDTLVARSWTLVRCVDYWLWGLGAGLTEAPVRCARIVDWLG